MPQGEPPHSESLPRALERWRDSEPQRLRKALALSWAGTPAWDKLVVWQVSRPYAQSRAICTEQVALGANVRSLQVSTTQEGTLRTRLVLASLYTLSNPFCHLAQLSPKVTIFSPIVQMRKLRLKGVKFTYPSSTTVSGFSWFQSCMSAHFS